MEICVRLFIAISNKQPAIMDLGKGLPETCRAIEFLRLFVRRSVEELYGTCNVVSFPESYVEFIGRVAPSLHEISKQ